MVGARVGWPRPGKRRDRNAAANGDLRARSRAPAGSASRVGYSDRRRTRPFRPSEAPGPSIAAADEAACSDPSPRKPDFVAQEHELLDAVARAPDVRPAARAERGRAALELPRRADHGQQPDGRPPRLGPRRTRTCSSASTRCSARTSASRTASTARACGSRSTSSATSGFTSKRDIEAYGIAEFVTPVQAARPDLRRAPDRAVDPPRACGWTGTTPPSCAGSRDLLAADPTQVTTIEGPDGPVTDTVEMLVGRLGHARDRRLVLHVQQREQRPHLGLPRRVPPARLAVQGPRLDAVVPALRHRPVPDGDERGLPGPRGPGADGPLPAGRPARARRSSSGRRRRGR